ncbi:MAG TPA: molecular chaperone TorD family protein [Acidobacteriota bacterium]|nr:molecular chaperone TorD family protein [Acidobacteriota bacterium]
MSEHTTGNEIDLALCRATLYSALALGFRPPTEENISRIVEPQNTAALTDAAAFLDPDDKSDLVAAIETVARVGRLDVAALASSYPLLFGHTARGAVPPYETEYGNEALFQQPQELGDLMGFYHAFGLMVNSSEHERADHISCECEFLSFLAMKEAYALEHRDAAMLDQTVKAEKLFLRDHLGRFLPTFARQLIREDAAGFYAQLADLCLHFVSQETERLAVRLGAVNLPLRPAEDDRVPMACGSGAECAAMPGACTPEGADSV